MRSSLVGLVLLSCLAAVSGCGTVGNVYGPQEYPHVYGGVEMDCLALQGTWSTSGSGGLKATQSAEEFGVAIFATSLVAIDFPLSLVGDTISLPYVLMRSGFRGWGSGYGRREQGRDQFPTEHPSELRPTDVLPVSSSPKLGRSETEK